MDLFLKFIVRVVSFYFFLKKYNRMGSVLLIKKNNNLQLFSFFLICNLTIRTFHLIVLIVCKSTLWSLNEFDCKKINRIFTTNEEIESHKGKTTP